MRKNVNVQFIVIIVAVLILLIDFSNTFAKESTDSLCLHVWNFRNDIGLACTDAFETAILEEKCCTFLNRSNVGLLLRQAGIEKSTSNVTEEDLKIIGASGVIYGKIVTDSATDTAIITIRAELFNSEILSQQQLIVSRQVLDSPNARRNKITELAERVCNDISNYLSRKIKVKRDFYLEPMLCSGYVPKEGIEPNIAFGLGLGSVKTFKVSNRVYPQIVGEAAKYENGWLLSFYLEGRVIDMGYTPLEFIVKIGYTVSLVDNLSEHWQGGMIFGSGFSLNFEEYIDRPLSLDCTYVRHKTKSVKRDGTTGKRFTFGQINLRISLRFYF